MSSQPIIIRRSKKRAKHFKHGGWKVAFADLMVALMCLFLVLWIIQILNSEDKQKIIQYFKDGTLAPEIHGNGVGNSISPMVLPHIATSREDAQLNRIEDKALIEGEYETPQELAVLAKHIKERVDALDIAESVKVVDLPQGVKVIIADNENGPMFYRSSVRVTPYYQDLMLALANELKALENKIMITGHTDSSKFIGSAMTNWELSANRANAARALLEEGGVKQETIFQVAGMADTVPLQEGEGYSAQNRRVELFIMTNKEKNSSTEMYKSQPINDNLSADQELLRQQFEQFKQDIDYSPKL